MDGEGANWNDAWTERERIEGASKRSSLSSSSSPSSPSSSSSFVAILAQAKRLVIATTEMSWSVCASSRSATSSIASISPCDDLEQRNCQLLHLIPFKLLVFVPIIAAMLGPVRCDICDEARGYRAVEEMSWLCIHCAQSCSSRCKDVLYSTTSEEEAVGLHCDSPEYTSETSQFAQYN